MSPVSRGRKTKKGKKPPSARPIGVSSRAGSRQPEQQNAPATVSQLLAGRRQQPDWFGPSTGAVVDGADMVMAADGPRRLEEVAAQLLGGQLRRVLREERAGLWFDWWFAQLTEALAARVRDELDRGSGVWEAPWRLLHGLASIGSPALASGAQAALRSLAADVAKASRADAAVRSQPQWLETLPRIAATGEVWQMRDAYGTRLAVIAGCEYPGGADPSVFLFDIDACGFVELVNAGVFGDVPQAAAAWRSMVGETADDAQPVPAETAEALQRLLYCDIGEETLHGTESDAALDNWFRARRRIHDLADALGRRGMPLPETRSLYRDIDETPTAQAFTTWYVTRHGVQPDSEAVAALAYEWIEGILPETRHTVSPHRVRFHRALMNDWIDDPVTAAAKTLLPDWVRWYGEQAGLPEHLVGRAVAAATGSPGTPADCGAALL